jgi:hypothetical protein
MTGKAEKIDPSVGNDRVRGSARGGTHDRVCAVTLPPDARALTTLDHVDYTDACRLETGLVEQRTAGGNGACLRRCRLVTNVMLAVSGQVTPLLRGPCCMATHPY